VSALLHSSRLGLLAGALLGIAVPVSIAAAVVLEVSGEIALEDAEWDGHGEMGFRFAILEGGVEVWRSHKANAFAGGSGFVRLAVRERRYTARLGDSESGMVPIPDTVGWRSPLALRVWIERSPGKSTRLEPDLELAQRQPKVAEPGIKEVLAELRALRQEVAALRQTTGGVVAPQKGPPEREGRVANRDHRPSIGADDAPFVLVEFTDQECGFCKRFDEETLPRLRERWIDTGRLRLSSAAYPLEMHPQARRIAGLLLAANLQSEGAYWTLRRRFQTEPTPTEEQLSSWAEELELHLERWLTDAEGDEVAAWIQTDLDDAVETGIRGTPTFVLGRLEEGRIQGVILEGLPEMAILEKWLDGSQPLPKGGGKP